MRFDDAPVDDVSLFIEPLDDELPLFIEPLELLESLGAVESVALLVEEPVAPVEPVLFELGSFALGVVPDGVLDDPLGLVDVLLSGVVVAPGVRPTFESWLLLPGVCVLVLPGLLVPEPVLPVPSVWATAKPPIVKPTTVASAVKRNFVMSYSHGGLVNKTLLACQAAVPSFGKLHASETTYVARARSADLFRCVNSCAVCR